jgi:hypothetical protein
MNNCKYMQKDKTKNSICKLVLGMTLKLATKEDD